MSKRTTTKTSTSTAVAVAFLGIAAVAAAAAVGGDRIRDSRSSDPLPAYNEQRQEQKTTSRREKTSRREDTGRGNAIGGGPVVILPGDEQPTLIISNSASSSLTPKSWPLGKDFTTKSWEIMQVKLTAVGSDIDLSELTVQLAEPSKSTKKQGGWCNINAYSLWDGSDMISIALTENSFGESNANVNFNLEGKDFTVPEGTNTILSVRAATYFHNEPEMLGEVVNEVGLCTFMGMVNPSDIEAMIADSAEQPVIKGYSYSAPITVFTPWPYVDWSADSPTGAATGGTDKVIAKIDLQSGDIDVETVLTAIQFALHTTIDVPSSRQVSLFKDTLQSSNLIGSTMISNATAEPDGPFASTDIAKHWLVSWEVDKHDVVFGKKTRTLLLTMDTIDASINDTLCVSIPLGNDGGTSAIHWNPELLHLDEIGGVVAGHTPSQQNCVQF